MRILTVVAAAASTLVVTAASAARFPSAHRPPQRAASKTFGWSVTKTDGAGVNVAKGASSSAKGAMPTDMRHVSATSSDVVMRTAAALASALPA